MVAQAGLVTMGLVDTWCAGRSSTEDMAAVALGSALTMLSLGAILGIAMGAEPLVAQAYGAGEEASTRHWRSQSMWTVSLVGVPAVLGVFLIALVLPQMGLAPGFEYETQTYLLGRASSVLFAGWYNAYRGYQNSLGRTRPAFIAVLVANIANFILNNIFLLVLGWGAFGIGLTTSISSLLMVFICRWFEDDIHVFERPNRASIYRIWRLGWPIAGHHVSEMGVFSLISILISLEGPVILGGHQVAINCAAFTFMAAVGLSVGASARVGFHVGGGRLRHARWIGFTTVGVGAVFMGLGGLCFYLFGAYLAYFFAPNAPEVQMYAVGFLKMAAVFSVSDGVQAVSAGALRGAGDTQSTFWANFLSHAMLGFPVALILGWGFDWRSIGYWCGLTVGLTSAAIILTHRFWKVTQIYPDVLSSAVVNEAKTS